MKTRSMESIKQSITQAILTVTKLDSLRQLKKDLDNGEVERCYGVKFEATAKRDFIQAIDHRLLTE